MVCPALEGEPLGEAVGGGFWLVCLLLFLRDERNVPGCDSADGGTSL